MTSVPQQVALFVVRRLPDWLSDAFRRIHENEGAKLSIEPDVREISMLLKQGRGIPVDAPPTLRPFTLSEAALQSSRNGNVRLQAVRILENVNAIKQGQELPFNPDGLTVIFGENGSGKSGYARVIQRACNIGPVGEKILSSIYASHGELMPASALFKFNEGKGDEKWEDKNGEQINGPSIAFYDSKVANIVVDKDNDVVFRPNELILLESLRESCDDIEGFIKKESADVRKRLNESSLGKIEGGSIAPNIKMVLGNAFYGVTGYKDIDDAEIDKMAIYSEDELDRVKRASKFDSSEAIMKEVEKLRKHRDDMLWVEKSVNELAGELCEIAAKLPSMLTALKEAKGAAEIFRRIFDEKYLPGTGGELWRQLYEAAKAFSERSAYPNEEFPVVRARGRCVLCQQDLAGDGVEAMKQFGEFVRNNATKTFEEQKGNINKIRKRLEDIGAQLESTSEQKSYASVESMRQLSDGKFGDMPKKIMAYCNVLSGRAQSLTEAIHSKLGKLEELEERGELDAIFSKLVGLSDLPDDSTQSIKMACEWISNEIDIYNQKISQHKTHEEKRRELMARQALALNLDLFKLLVRLNRCICEIRENKAPITNAVDSIYEESDGRLLKNNLNAEIEYLGKLMDGKDVRFKLHGGGGHPKIQMIIKGTKVNLKSNRISLSQIFSEGERNCVALASFLAQAFVPDGPTTLVFDDPASSVDADRIEIIAERLREVAKHKQVIVFTHDVSFARLLCEEGVCRHGIWKHGQERGIVDDIPFAAAGCAAQIETLEKKVEELEEEQPPNSGEPQMSPSEMQENIEACYRRLRMAIEAFVEEKILERVITRKKAHLVVSKIVNVYANSTRKGEIAKNLHHLYKRVSERMHKREIAAVLSLPELKEHLIELRSYLDEFESIRNSLSESSSSNGDSEGAVAIQDGRDFSGQDEFNN